MVILDLFSHFESLNNTEKIFSVPKLGIVSYGISMTTLEEVFLRLEKEEDYSDNETSNLEESKGLKSNALLTARETNKDASSSNLYASAAVFQQTGSSDRKCYVSLWVHFMALLKLRFTPAWQTSCTQPAIEILA